MPRPEWLTLPNLFTFLRLGLVPVFLALFFLGDFRGALICFASAALSDAIDGLLARVLNQRSRLGALLDPVADKVLMFSALSALVLGGWLPVWLWAGVFLRDLFLAGVAWTVRWRRMEWEVTPSRIGKYATFALSLVIGLLLLNAVMHREMLSVYTRVLELVSGLAVVISAVQYVARFSPVFWGSKPAGDAFE